MLIVANRTAATPTLLEEVRRRGTQRPHRFALLIPDAGSRSDHDWTLERAVPRFGGVRVGESGRDGEYDEIIVSTSRAVLPLAAGVTRPGAV